MALLRQEWFRESVWISLLRLHIRCLSCCNRYGVYCAVRSGTTDKMSYVSSLMCRSVKVEDDL